MRITVHARLEKEGKRMKLDGGKYGDYGWSYFFRWRWVFLALEVEHQ